MSGVVGFSVVMVATTAAATAATSTATTTTAAAEKYVKLDGSSEETRAHAAVSGYECVCVCLAAGFDTYTPQLPTKRSKLRKANA